MSEIFHACPVCRDDQGYCIELASFCCSCGYPNQNLSGYTSDSHKYDTYRQRRQSREFPMSSVPREFKFDKNIIENFARGNCVVSNLGSHLISVDLSQSCNTGETNINWEIPYSKQKLCIINSSIFLISSDLIEWFHLNNPNYSGRYEIKNTLSEASGSLKMIPFELFMGKKISSGLAVFDKGNVVFFLVESDHADCNKTIVEKLFSLEHTCDVSFMGIDEKGVLLICSDKGDYLRLDLNNVVNDDTRHDKEFIKGEKLAGSTDLHRLEWVHNLGNKDIFLIRDSNLQSQIIIKSAEESRSHPINIKNKSLPIFDWKNQAVYLQTHENNHLIKFNLGTGNKSEFLPDYADINYMANTFNFNINNLWFANDNLFGIFPNNIDDDSLTKLSLCRLEFSEGQYRVARIADFSNFKSENSSLENRPVFCTNGRFIGTYGEYLLVVC